MPIDDGAGVGLTSSVAMGRLGDDAAFGSSLSLFILCAPLIMHICANHGANVRIRTCMYSFIYFAYICIWHVYRIIRPKGAAVLCIIRMIIHVRIMYNTYYVLQLVAG